MSHWNQHGHSCKRCSLITSFYMYIFHPEGVSLVRNLFVQKCLTVFVFLGTYTDPLWCFIFFKRCDPLT